MKAEQAVDKILNELDGRKGFAYWWVVELEPKIRDEIKAKLTAILAEGVTKGGDANESRNPR